MTADRWAQVDRIYHAALEQAASERGAFLARACAGDEALLAEIQSLLAYEPAAMAFLERPALEEAAKGLIADRPAGDWQLAGYRSLALIGSGGMGDVYRARDSRLGREVALKILARSAAGGPASLRRFEEEARLASVLNHPNIVTIYGVGEEGDFAYIAMELVHGRTLRDCLGAETLSVLGALDLAVQLADALAAAHASGIVHRDLKPENLMVTPDGLLKVLDFGIAKRQGDARAAADGPALAPASATNTQAGTILGTVGYMSPEQAAGRPVRHTSDQFSFGAILYEMLSGRRAFKRGSNAATLDAILREEPERIESLDASVERPLRALLARCLAKDPADRFADTRELASELRNIRELWDRRAGAEGLSRRRMAWLGGAAAVLAAAGLGSWRLWGRGTGIRSLAVLPFGNAARDAEADLLCDGLTESLIRRISRLTALTVRPRSAVNNFKGKTTDPRAAGQQLAADAVVSGTVARQSGRLLISAELLDVGTGERLWSNTYNRAASDVLSLEDEIASAIIDEGVRLRLTTAEHRSLVQHPTEDPEAYELYLRGVHAYEHGQEAEYLAGRAFLRQATARDNTFSLAYAALATTYALMVVDGLERPTEAWPESNRNSSQALLIDPELRDAHAAAAAEAFFFNWNWPAAEREWNLVMKPGGEIITDFWRARAIQQWALGRLPYAIDLARKAREIDPLTPEFALTEADYLLQAGQGDAAVQVYERVLRDAPANEYAWLGLAEARRVQGRFDEAIGAQRRAYPEPADESFRRALASARGAEGYRQVDRAAARLELASLRMRASSAYASPLDFARAHARLGEKDRSLGYFDAAFADRAPGLTFLKVDRAWDSIRDDSRFVAAVRRVGLP